jgi:hypothetical protein
MSAHKRLSRQLRASVARAGDRRPGLASRLRLWSGGLPVLVIVATTTVAVAAAAVSIEATRPKDPGPIPHNVDDRVVAAAWNTAWAKDPACRPVPVGSTSSVTSATPGQAFFSTFPILRRPMTAADQLPAPYNPGAGRPLGLLAQSGDIYSRYVRRVRVVPGTTFYLVPMTGLGGPPVSPAVADHCYELTVAALAASLHQVPKAERAATRRYGRAEFAEGRYNLERRHTHTAVFIVYSHAEGGGADGGQSPATIRRTGMLGGFGGGIPHEPSTMYGIVPPGVATVTIRFPATHHGTRRLPPLDATGKVINNVFVIRVPSLFSRHGWPASEVWRSASGRVIKTVNERKFQP